MMVVTIKRVGDSPFLKVGNWPKVEAKEVYEALDALGKAGMFRRPEHGAVYGRRYSGDPPLYVGYQPSYSRTTDLCFWVIRSEVDGNGGPDGVVYFVSIEVRSNGQAVRFSEPRTFEYQYGPKPNQMWGRYGILPAHRGLLEKPTLQAERAIIAAAKALQWVSCAVCGKVRYYPPDEEAPIMMLLAMRCNDDDQPFHYIDPVVQWRE